MSRNVLAFAVLCLASSTAIAEGLSLDGQDCFHHRAELAPGQAFEICGSMPQGEKLTWKFLALAPVEFALRQGAMEYAAPTVASTSGGQFVAPAAQRYCWLWTNRGEREVAVAIDFDRP